MWGWERERKRSVREKNKTMEGNRACWDGLAEVAFRQRPTGGKGASCGYLGKESTSQREQPGLRFLRWTVPGMVKEK